jgi:hypothetical protein
VVSNRAATVYWKFDLAFDPSHLFKSNRLRHRGWHNRRWHTCFLAAWQNVDFIVKKHVPRLPNREPLDIFVYLSLAVRR